MEPVVEAELMESAELVRVDLTRSLDWGRAGQRFCFLGRLGDISWLAWSVPWGTGDVVLGHWGSHLLR